MNRLRSLASARSKTLTLFCLSLFSAQLATAQTPEPETPSIKSASDEGQIAIKQFRFPAALNCELFAAEPDVANIVAFHRDYQGRMFVCETFRQNVNTGVEDNRSHAEWLDDDLQALTVQDRIDYIRKHIPDADIAYTAKDDRIRLLVDTDHDGKADRSTVFADHFNRLEMGTGAGVLSYLDQVYYTCIPDLYSLTDDNDDGVADQRNVLHSGFGVRFAFRGHDMHGLIVGPDGRLYFSIGDRGYHVSSEIHDATSGAVFRCELDGSNLEVFATGLRNPQELAFDDYGNLFTGDNNSDSGDKARWVYVVPGGDSGWRMYYQYLPDRGPFNREKIWHPFSSETPAYIIPPVDNFADGPSGLEYYPGTGFADDFSGRFFLCDFRGGPSNSGVRSFRSKQVGAFWEIADREQLIWGILATDLDFGSDGRLYISDWVNGWVGENKGRIYSLLDPEKIDTTLVKEVQTLLNGRLRSLPTNVLRPLLGHADQRVRQETQFELVRRNDIEALTTTALNDTNRLARVHAIWGLAQSRRLQLIFNGTSKTAPARIEAFEMKLTDISEKLLSDKDFEIRAQAAKLIGDASLSNTDAVVPLLSDANLRVRYYAAMALALNTASATESTADEHPVQAIASMIAENNDADPIVRHGGIMALKHFLHRGLDAAQSATAATALVGHKSPSVRLALSVAIRKIFADPTSKDIDRDQLLSLLKKLLRDSDQNVFTETVRAIHDTPIDGAMSDLASQIDTLNQHLNGSINDDAILRRVINANLRIGKTANANGLAALAGSLTIPIERRAGALTALTQWMEPPNKDAVLNDWRPISIAGRELSDAQRALTENFASLVTQPDPISRLAIEAVGKLKLSGLGQQLANVVFSENANETNRVSALISLAGIEYPNLSEMIRRLETNFSNLPPQLAAKVAEMVSKSDAERGVGLLKTVFNSEKTELPVKQNIFITLGELSDQGSASWLEEMMAQLKSGTIPAELRLDVIQACLNREEEKLTSAADIYLESLTDPKDPSAAYANSLLGGNGAAGQQIFFGKTEVSCVRCHAIDGTGGAVGPDLSGVSIKNDRHYLLDAIVQPNKVITEGFGQIKVQTFDGLIHTGLLVAEDDREIQLLDADGKTITIPQDDVDGIKPGLSAMPDDLVKQLTPRELRDLIEYLANRTTPTDVEAEEGH